MVHSVVQAPAPRQRAEQRAEQKAKQQAPKHAEQQASKRSRVDNEPGQSMSRKKYENPSVGCAKTIHAVTQSTSTTDLQGKIEPIKTHCKLYATIATSTTGLASLSLIEYQNLPQHFDQATWTSIAEPGYFVS